MGGSGVEPVDLGRLYNTMARGNKQCAAFSEFCFPEPDRRGVALSRLAEVMVKNIDRLRACPHLRGIVKEDALAMIDAEMDALYPHFVVLNRGNNQSLEGGSIRSIAYSQPFQAAPDDPAAAARAVYAWLCRPTSPFRTAMALFSAGGLFYVAQCHEKGARAVVGSVPIDVRQFKQAAVARRGTAGNVSVSELSGLAHAAAATPER